MNLTIYEKLLSLPLFQGLSQEKLTVLLERCKFEFSNYQNGDVIVETAKPLDALFFVFSGKVQSKLINKNRALIVIEHYAEMCVIPPSNLYGRERCSPFEVTAIGEVVMLKLAREEIVTMVQLEQIVLINLLNILSTRSQITVNVLLSMEEASCEKRLAFWILNLTHRQGSEIYIKCKQKLLAKLLSVSCSSLVGTLDKWKALDIIVKVDDCVFAVRNRTDIEDVLKS